MSSSDEDARAFLQGRVALFGKVMTGISLAGLVAQLVTDVFVVGSFTWAPTLLSALTGASSLGIWLSCRTGERSQRFSRIAESAGLSISIIFVMVIGRFLVPLTLSSSIGVDVAAAAPGALEDEMTLAQTLVLMSISIGVTHACVVRAALVP
jgi:hypothetical protein